MQVEVFAFMLLSSCASASPPEGRNYEHVFARAPRSGARNVARGLSEHSERYARSSLPRVSSHACGVRGFGDLLHRGLRASRLPPADSLHRSAVPARIRDRNYEKQYLATASGVVV